MATITELRTEYGKTWHEMKALNDAASGRAMTAEEEQNWARLDATLQSLEGEIKRGERVRDAERRAVEDTKPADSEPGNSKGGRSYSAETRSAFNRALAYGVHSLSPDEARDLQADSDTAGGYLTPDMQFMNELIKAVDDQTIMRQVSRVIPVNGADSLGAPVLDNRAGAATWGTELTVATADSTMSFGRRELTPHDLTIYIKVSQKLLQKSGIPAEQLVRDELAYSAAITEEQGFLSGSGSGQPLGVFTASTLGISTGRDVSTGNTSTAIGADGLIEAKHSLKANYWPRARWIFHRTAIKNIRKLKDGDGQYLWQPGIAAGLPAQICEVPYLISEYAPSTFTTGLYVGIIGDFSRYWIADDMGMSLQRLNELLALTNQVGFIGRMRVDGMPVLEEAFARVTLA